MSGGGAGYVNTGPWRRRSVPAGLSGLVAPIGSDITRTHAEAFTGRQTRPLCAICDSVPAVSVPEVVAAAPVVPQIGSARWLWLPVARWPS